MPATLISSCLCGEARFGDHMLEQRRPDSAKSQPKGPQLGGREQGWRRALTARGGKRLISAVFFSAALACLLGEAVPTAFAQRETPALPNVFERPAFATVQNRLTLPVIALFGEQRYAEAEATLRELVAMYPHWPIHHYNLAAALARQDRPDDALDSLAEAFERGFANRAALEQDPDLDSLRRLPRFQQMSAEIAPQGKQTGALFAQSFELGTIEDRKALVDESNTIWLPRNNSLLAGFHVAPSLRNQNPHSGDGRVAELLNRWYERGEAAGNHGDLYDNRDDGHSALPRGTFAQITHVEYGNAARAAGVHYGVNSNLFFNAITFGNSSTAVTGGFFWRSQARHILINRQLVLRAFEHYANDHLYIYPEHRDHDPEHGDLLPANTPYMLVSQGSSGSDQPHLNAVAAILAAFDPNVKARLRAEHLIMPTVQMIFRRGLATVENEEDYLSAIAHPSAFDGTAIDLEKMVRIANALGAGDIPPRVNIAVVEEDKPEPGIDYFGPSAGDEVLFDTPSAIARIARSSRFEHRMVISAKETEDPNGRPLTFIWKVLRGDAEAIVIDPQNEDSAIVELSIPWHARRAVPGKPELSSHRVDIAVFAYNGVHYSAPSFVSIFFPPNQARTYGEANRILEIDYAPAKFAERYADPVLFAKRDWRDTYIYTDAGELRGWNRRSNGVTRFFTRHGAHVVESDAAGRPLRAERILYEVGTDGSGLREIVEVPTSVFITYRYDTTTDQLGTPEF